MPAIPEFVLRKLYVADSLKPMEGAFTFELNNTFAPVTLTGLVLTADEDLCDPANIYLSLPGLGEIPAGGISRERPFSLPINTTIKVHVYGPAPRQRLVIRVDTREAGVLQFGIPLTTPIEQKRVKKKTGFFKKLNRRFRYFSQVFRVQQDPQHPSYHYSPPANWMNDPNGLIYWKGNYHLFYQYNPFEPVWGNIHWGHAISKDMLHWKHLPIALLPDPNGADAGGCYSGCAVDYNDTPTLLYTGVYPETQCLATSPVDDLGIWQKRAMPVIAAPPQGMQLEGFRDPCVWREAAEWRMALGSGLSDVGGAVLLYRSKDLLDWHYMGILFHSETRISGSIQLGSMWECPCFFPLGDKWVLMVSVCDAGGPIHTIYYTGRYSVDRFIPDGAARLVDGSAMLQQEPHQQAGGCFYAPQTFVERKGRRVMIGWLREARSTEEQVKAGWSGTMTLPRYLSLSDKGELCCRPPENVQSLRREHERLTKPNQLSDVVRGASFEMTIKIPPTTEKWSGVNLTGGRDTSENVLIGVDSLNSAVVVDCRHADGVISIVPVELPGVEEINLHVFIDGSVIEVYYEDRLPTSARFYMQKPQALRVRLVGEASAELWKLKI